MLTIAAPSSGYLLRGMETFDVTKYLDYVNIMSYDLHGAWNDHVGHNAALYDTGKDSELAQWNVYGTAQYGGIGYLNTDWAYHYFRGSMPAGRINIGVPYYTRGWQGVTGGENGLWAERHCRTKISVHRVLVKGRKTTVVTVQPVSTTCGMTLTLQVTKWAQALTQCGMRRT